MTQHPKGFCFFIFTFWEGKLGRWCKNQSWTARLFEFCFFKYKVIKFVVPVWLKEMLQAFWLASTPLGVSAFSNMIVQSKRFFFVSSGAINLHAWLCGCVCPARPAAEEGWCPSSGCYPRWSRSSAGYISSPSPIPQSESWRSLSPKTE